MKKLILKVTLLLSLLLLAVGCAVPEDELPNRSSGADSDASSAAGSKSELTYDGPEPSEGTGNVYGQIMWNGTGAPGLDVSLCGDFSSFSGCREDEYLVETNEDGIYLLENVAPGTYALSVRVFDSDDWLYVTSGILSSADFVVEADETLVVGVQNIFKLDLAASFPANEARAKSGELTLSWEAYPDADYYKIYLTPVEGEAILVDKRVDDTEITVDLLPANCDYRWSLEAFNSDRVKIAETEDFYTFRVAGEDASCILVITAPLDGRTIPGTSVTMDWEPNPLATTYKLLMWNDSTPDQENILDFVSVAESSYRFDETLEPGRYVWSVTGYNDEGKEVAGSEVFDFTIEE